MVLGQFEKYFANGFETIAGIHKADFRILLALHDIGKPKALQETGSKEEQHVYTLEMLSKLLPRFSVRPREAEIMIGVIHQDFLGDYMKGIIGVAQTVELMKQRAKELRIAQEEYYALIKTYYMCDAGSYTEDAGGKYALDGLFEFDAAQGKMQFSSKVQQEVARLENALLKAD